ncbi:hypothetical protein CEV32_0247 [Brucella rhizosphaerae]|uniref:Uncharacterized protein n=1 Tax=Brucella rhizosphaerae TaxID=571254 RepID=A0A256FHE6_9HYPH|nr:hypothetical protein CEV32_0247 [Brucella rhizosphaerae]
MLLILKSLAHSTKLDHLLRLWLFAPLDAARFTSSHTGRQTLVENLDESHSQDCCVND